MLVFAICVIYRLYNEVWSNSRVIADFYGRETKNYQRDDGSVRTVHASDPWWAAAVLATALPLLYVFCGGMRASLLSDSAQAGLAVVTLIVVLAAIQAERADHGDLRRFARSYSHWGLFEWAPNPEISPLSLKGGMDMFALGAVQGGLSYAFFDPVLTDRCFLAAPKTMARAFTVGGFAAAWFITLFSLIGVHGSMLGKCVQAGVCDASRLRGADVAAVAAGAPHAVAQTLGTVLFSFVNIIMVFFAARERSSGVPPRSSHRRRSRDLSPRTLRVVAVAATRLRGISTRRRRDIRLRGISSSSPSPRPASADSPRYGVVTSASADAPRRSRRRDPPPRTLRVVAAASPRLISAE